MGSREDRAYDRRWLILVILCSSLLMIVIDNTILNVAIPHIVAELGVGDRDLQWIVDAYTITFAGLLLAAGSLGDRFGRRGALQVGFVVFGAGSLLAATAHGSGALIAGRAVTGIGGACIMPATLSILSHVFPSEERPRAISIWTAVAGLGVALGPLVGGWLVERFSFSSVFLVNVPLVVIASAATAAWVPTSRDPAAPPVDVPGVVLSTLGVAAVLYAIIEGPTDGWLDQRIVVAALGGSAILGAFAWWERTTAHPMLDLDLFRNRHFSAASASITVIFFGLFGALFITTQYFQFVLGYSPFETGVRMLPFAIAVAVSAPVSPVLAARLGARTVTLAGLALVTASLASLTSLDQASTYGAVCWRLLVLAVGMGLVMPTGTDGVMRSLPAERSGIGSAVNDMTRELGGALGIAVVGSIVASSYAPAIARFFADKPVPPDVVHIAQGGVGRALYLADQIRGLPLPDAGTYANELSTQSRDYFVTAMHAGFAAAAVATALGLVGVYLLMPARDARPSLSPPEETSLKFL